MRKTPFRLAAVLLAFCIAASLFPPVGLAAEVEDYFDLSAAINAAPSGGTVTLTKDAIINLAKDETPWTILKDVTIDGQGRTIVLRAGGILLGENVTFENVRLEFTSSTRNAVIANGYALTLDGVTAAGYPFNVFGGTLLPNSYEEFQVPSPGTANTVTIRGSTNLQGSSAHVVGDGNIYAGSLCMGGMKPETGDLDGEANAFSGNPVIRIEGCANPGGGVLPLGQIYAGGAQQKNTPNVEGQKRTLPDSDSYTVDGTVTITGAKIPDVDGAGATKTLVEYDGQYLDTKVFCDISGLSVRSGNLALDQGSSFRQDGDTSLSISSGAKLTVSSLYGAGGSADFTVDDFTGDGGILIMGANQTMTAARSAAGSAKVAVGGTNNSNTQSTDEPILGHTYIQAPASGGVSFELLPSSSKPRVKLVRDENGNWTAVEEASSGDEDLVKTFRFDTATATVEAGQETSFSLTAENTAGAPVYLDFIPLTIDIDGKTASRTEQEIDGDTYYTYTHPFGYFSMEIIGNDLLVSTNELCDPDNYTIRIIVPGENAVGGKALYQDAVLTVTKGGGGDPDPGPVDPVLDSISVNSTGHKIEYKVGELLDVSGLTIEAAYSNGSKRTVAVTADMVSGFDSSQAAERRTLTITYEGKTTTYDVRITAAPEPPDPPDKTSYQLTVSNTGEGGTPAGTYSYQEGADVTVRAGSRAGFGFAAWDAGDLPLDNRNSPDLRFKMPARNVSLNVIWSPGGVTPPTPSHTHAWSSAWKSSASHHWHDCAASGCPITANSEKSGYAAHTAGDWVVDRPATSSQNGIRHRSCTVCGYEMIRETLPAAGGGSSSGGSDGGSSSGGSSSSGGGSSNTTTVKQPDGSSVSTTVNKTTGTVTETTRRPDGSKTVVETKKDGTVTTTETAKDGSTVKTVERPDGTAETTVKRADGLTASVREDRNGARADVRLPSKTVQESQKNGGTIALPIPALPGRNADVVLRTGSVRLVRVEIPAEGDAGTTVAYLVGGDGSETLIKTAVLNEGRITLSVPDGATVRLRDNGKDFHDTRGHWAEDAIGFVTARELFSGRTPTAFSPDAPMSRAMLMTVLARLDGVNASGASAYETGAAWAVAQGISDGRNPETPVTREQFAAMLHRCAGSPAATDRELRFSDEEAVSSYAREAILWAVENGILSGYGDGSFVPGGRTTRAQAVAMLARYVNFLSRQ